jgi:glycosyltransferase involved in cell wall biosynthesis
MKFSVLMSVYYKDSPSALDKALESVLIKQELLPDELILVEDGPLNEPLYAVINHYKSKYPVQILSLPQNIGLGGALNLGLTQCNYSWIARMDSDDISMPHRFSSQMAVIEKHPDLDVVGAWIDEFDSETTSTIATRKVPEMPEQIYEFAKKRSPVNHPVVFLKKSAVIEAGNYQPFQLQEDWYLWARMLLKDCRFYNIPQSLLYFRADTNLYKRRGGFTYFKREISLQIVFHKIGFLTYLEVVRNIAVRIVFRFSSSKLRSLLYKTFLR